VDLPGQGAAYVAGQTPIQGAPQQVQDIPYPGQASGADPMAAPSGHVVPAPRKRGKRKGAIIAVVVAVAIVIAVVFVNGAGGGLGGHKNPLSIMYYAIQETTETPGVGDISVEAKYGGVSVIDLNARLGKDLKSSTFALVSPLIYGSIYMADGDIVPRDKYDNASDVATVDGLDDAIRDRFKNYDELDPMASINEQERADSTTVEKFFVKQSLREPYHHILFYWSVVKDGYDIKNIIKDGKFNREYWRVPYNGLCVSSINLVYDNYWLTKTAALE
jgi:hypothetical protein